MIREGKTARAIWKGEILAESNEYETVEGNIYFPPSKEGDRQYTCPWKGKTRYYDIEVQGKVNPNTAWSYPEPKEAALNIKGHVAFEGSVEVAR
ncbi:MAG: DUF427 domain-containing protein [Chloroflexota bacterium]